MLQIQSFEKAIHIGNNEYAKFIFNPIHVSGAVKYFVSVIYNGKLDHVFSMNFQNDNWKIIMPEILPSWVKELENELSLAIIENQ
ncbi:MAG: hypothetical protein ACJ748_14770 [Flavisolibacter sp.]